MCIPSVVSAFDVSVVDVDYQDGAYHVNLVVDLEANAERVRDIILRHQELKGLSPTIVESDLLTHVSADPVRIRVVLRPCIWIFCKSLVKVSDVTTESDGTIVYHAVPEQSSFQYARESIRIMSWGGTRTRFRYLAELKLKRSIFPLIGAGIVKRKMRQGLLSTARQVEQAARGDK